MHHREIKHIYHFAMQEASIAVRRKNLCHVRIGAFFENKAIKQAIDQITQGTGIDQRCANDKAPGIALLYNSAKIPATKTEVSDQAQVM